MKWQISSSWRNERTDMDYSKQNNDTKKKKKITHALSNTQNASYQLNFGFEKLQ